MTAFVGHRKKALHGNAGLVTTRTMNLSKRERHKEVGQMVVYFNRAAFEKERVLLLF